MICITGYYQSHVNGGVMLENVAWNTSALMIKGDQHNVTRNTVFGGADTSSSSAIHDRPKYQDHNSSLDNLSIPSATVGVVSNVPLCFRPIFIDCSSAFAPFDSI